MTIHNICEAIELGLKAEQVDVKDVKWANNNTFIVTFTTKHNGTVDVKSEIGLVISFLHGLLKEGFEISPRIKFFGAKAINEDNHLLMHAISSLDAAAKISAGNSIGWLQGTQFVENTDEHKLHTAKRIISEIENGLRGLICLTLKNHHGKEWWETCVGKKTKELAETMYENQEGILVRDGKLLINYTFLRDLKGIIVSNWEHFKHIFIDQQSFKSHLEDLNGIRRIEAHNRQLSDSDLNNLQVIYKQLMEKICKVYPEATEAYLTENWMKQISSSFNNFVDQKVDIVEGKQLPETLVLLRTNLSLYQDLEASIRGIVVPLGKQDLHDKLVMHVSNVRSSLAEMLECGERLDIESLLKATEKHSQIDKEFSLFTKDFILTIS